MRRAIGLVTALAFAATTMLGQYNFNGEPGHVTINHSHTDNACGGGYGVCYGYAMGISAGKSVGGTCDPATMIPLSCSHDDWNNWTVDQSRWTYHNDPYLITSSTNIIVDFGGHVAVISQGASSQGNPLSLSGSHILAPGYAPENVTLNWDSNTSSYKLVTSGGTYHSQGYYTAITYSATANNHFYDLQNVMYYNVGVVTLAGVTGTPTGNGLTVSNLSLGGTYFAVATSPQPYPTNYYQLFDHWSYNGTNIGSSLSVQISLPAQYVFIDEFYVAAQVFFVPTNGGIQVAGQTYYSNFTHYPRVTPGQVQAVVATAIDKIDYSILTKYVFSDWSNSNGAHYYTYTFTDDPPQNLMTWTANFHQKPLPPSNVWVGGSVGSYVHVTWDVHPNTNVVRYDIWRRVKENGQLMPEQQVATINSRTTSSWYDYDYQVTSGYTDDIVNYDVRPVLSNGQTSDPSYVGGVFATNEFAGKAEDQQLSLNSTPEKFDVSAYPNPFNPSTKIFFSLAAEARVSIQIFDVAGHEVTSLVDEVRNEGQYEITWNATGRDGIHLPSGVYFVRFEATPTNGGKPFVKSGRLVLLK